MRSLLRHALILTAGALAATSLAAVPASAAASAHPRPLLVRPDVNSAPVITSASSATSYVGATFSFTVTTTGVPTPSLSESGALPSGVTFTDNGDGTATFYGDPAAGSGGTYSVTVTATNTVGSAHQTFVLTNDQAPTITSPSTAAFYTGVSGTYQVTTTGYPSPTITESGTLPSGLGFSGGTGTATISGTPASGSAGTYSVSLSATNASGSTATLTLTITVASSSAPSITSASSAYFWLNSAGSVAITTTGVPAPALTESGALPAGLSFTDNGNGTATFSGTPTATGTATLTITATNAVGTTSQTYTLYVGSAPSFTSAGSTSFGYGASSSFTVTTSGYPAPWIGYSGTLPTGVSFVNNGDGTATLSGTPTQAGTYTLDFSADSAYGSASQSFTLTVTQAPSITSANTVNFYDGVAGSFTVTTVGYPAPSLSASGSLPSGVTFTDNGNGTATIAGTPAAGTAGSYPVTISATNASGTVTQSFTLVNTSAPTITSASATTFYTGVAGTYQVTTTGYPAPSITESGALPSGISFTDNGNGTGTISGTAASGSAGSYPVSLSATNSSGSTATLTLTITVDASSAPVITSASSAYFWLNSAGSVAVTTTGVPAPHLTESGTLPAGLSFTDNGDGTATISGTPTATGTATLTITATNAVGTTSQTFTLYVGSAPSFTSAASTDFGYGSASSFTVTTSGYPAPWIGYSGTLPAGVSFVNNGDGTATISGTPTQSGTFTLSLAADSAYGSTSQSLTIVVSRPAAFTSASSAIFYDGVAGSFTVTTVGYPAPSLTESGSLPSGVTFTDNGDGTATIAGTPAAGTQGTYSLTLTATNGGGSVSESFTLLNTTAPTITSPNSAAFYTGVAGTYQVTTTGYPAPSITESGTLPSGLSFTDHGNGTGTISGKPASGSAGTYSVSLSATNASGSTATLTLTITVSTSSAPTITSSASAYFWLGSAGSIAVTASGVPAPAITESGTLPAGLSFTDDGGGTATVAGTPTATGTYTLTFTATNAVGTTSQSFTLYVGSAPAFTSSSSASFTHGVHGSFSITTSGYPAPWIGYTGSLPNGISFTNNGNGTASLSGTPTTAGTYSITLDADSSYGSTSQTLTITVH